MPAVLAIHNHAVEHTTATYDLVPVSLTGRLKWYDRMVVKGWPVLVAVGENGRSWDGAPTARPRKTGYRQLTR